MENIAEKVSEALKKAESEATVGYSQSTPLRSVVAAIPLIGSPIDAFLETRGQDIAARRIARVIEEINNQVEAIDKSKVDHEYLDSEEFYNIVWRAFEHGQRNCTDESLFPLI